MDDSIILKRLAFIKYLHTTAVQQSQQPEPMSSASILTFHDSIELFLHLATEHYNIHSDKNVNFMQYWDLLKPKIPNGGLNQKESMQRLNTARVALKHHGTLPSKLNIEEFRVNSTAFFRENSLLIFNKNFDKISLIDLVICEKTREYLQFASQYIQDNKLEDALDQIALAFRFLIIDYEDRKRNDFGKSPFFFGQSLMYLNSFSMGIRDYQLSQFVDRVKESIVNMQEAMKIITLGIDYRRYIKYRLFVPNIVFTSNGPGINEPNWNIYRLSRQKPINCEEAHFCFNFVIESAITLQEFDFTISKESDS